MSEKIPEVKVGQIWTSNDKRDAHRPPFVIDSIIEGNVFVKKIVNGEVTGNARKIKLSRMRPTSNGYLLVKDVA